MLVNTILIFSTERLLCVSNDFCHEHLEKKPNRIQFVSTFVSFDFLLLPSLLWIIIIVIGLIVQISCFYFVLRCKMFADSITSLFRSKMLNKTITENVCTLCMSESIVKWILLFQLFCVYFLYYNQFLYILFCFSLGWWYRSQCVMFPFKLKPFNSSDGCKRNAIRMQQNKVTMIVFWFVWLNYHNIEFLVFSFTLFNICFTFSTFLPTNGAVTMAFIPLFPFTIITCTFYT